VDVEKRQIFGTESGLEAASEGSEVIPDHTRAIFIGSAGEAVLSVC